MECDPSEPQAATVGARARNSAIGANLLRYMDGSFQNYYKM